jgi:branched-subunit amino acid aminotransferase/4-amino-4-deoxychorismate lyase
VGRACYTSARVRAGRVLGLERHAARLVRDAALLGLPALDPGRVQRALGELAETFGRGEGVVRLQAGRDAEGRPQLLGSSRPLGPEPPHWRAELAPDPHPGPGRWSGVKLAGATAIEAAREHARARGLDEALLCDRSGFLVEGARSNLLWVDAAGRLGTPDPARGAVRGLCWELLRERLPELACADLHRDALPGVVELVAVNAVRGARPILCVDGWPVGDGEPGPWAARLEELLAEE